MRPAKPAWKLGDSLRFAPSNVLEEKIEPFIQNVLADPGRKIISIKDIDYAFCKQSPEWSIVLTQTRRKVISDIIMRISPTAKRECKANGKMGHVFYR